MHDLTKIVIPKIMSKWQYVAEAFRYDLEIIEAIEVKKQGDPKTCCREFFRNWLTTNNGAKAGQKQWSTLINILKEVDEIPSDAVDEIIAKVKQLNN